MTTPGKTVLEKITEIGKNTGVLYLIPNVYSLEDLTERLSSGCFQVMLLHLEAKAKIRQE